MYKINYLQLFFIFQQYLDAAEQDKERYNKEFNDYKQTDAYKLFLEKQSTKKDKKEVKKEKESNGTDTIAPTPTATENNVWAFVNLNILFFYICINEKNILISDISKRKERGN